MGEDHARVILDEYVRHYKEGRAHQALGTESRLPREEARVATGKVISIPHLGGLHPSCRRAA